MATSQALERGQQAFQEKSWVEARDQLSIADQESPLGVDDLERLAIAAHMTAHEYDSLAAWERAHEECLSLGEVPRAARCAFWLALLLTLTGELAPANGWVRRAHRLLDGPSVDCVERGYLLVPEAVHMLHQGESVKAYSRFRDALDVAHRFRDEQLTVLAMIGIAQSLIGTGKTEEGFEVLDEVMVSLATANLSPLTTGFAYCVAIDCCQATFDLRRAQAWTENLGRWCEAQAGLVPFHRECLVHRSELLQLGGSWDEAMREAQRAGMLTSRDADAGPALYQQGELLRLQGEFSKAEECYRMCNRTGHSVQPALGLLRLAQGQIDAAATSIKLAMSEAGSPVERSRLLPAHVEIMLAADDLKAARAAANELSALADVRQAPLLSAVSRSAMGAVMLREGDTRGALSELRHAFSEWQTIESPYEAARTRVLVGLACRALGDEDTAEMEFDAARWVFQQLGAVPDQARLEVLARKPEAESANGLTTREIQVLRLVAAGKTNRAIAADLFVSEHTIRRHLQNIFSKLGVSSRAAASAFAVQRKLA